MQLVGGQGGGFVLRGETTVASADCCRNCKWFRGVFLGVVIVIPVLLSPPALRVLPIHKDRVGAQKMYKGKKRRTERFCSIGKDCKKEMCKRQRGKDRRGDGEEEEEMFGERT